MKRRIASVLAIAAIIISAISAQIASDYYQPFSHEGFNHYLFQSGELVEPNWSVFNRLSTEDMIGLEGSKFLVNLPYDGREETINIYIFSAKKLGNRLLIPRTYKAYADLIKDNARAIPGKMLIYIDIDIVSQRNQDWAKMRALDQGMLSNEELFFSFILYHEIGHIVFSKMLGGRFGIEKEHSFRHTH